jgi:putative transposase
MRLARSTGFYRSVKRDDPALRMRLRELAAARPRFGYRRLYILLRREGWRINHKKVHRVYREEGLYVRTKRRRKHVSRARVPRPPAAAPRERWSMDFVADGLVQRRRVRIFAAIDNHTRECVCLEPDYTMPSRTVTTALDAAIAASGKPQAITCDDDRR